MSKLKKVLIMAGGTGGHVFPGLAVAKLLREQGTQVDWLGTRKGLEARLVPEASFPMHFISISGLRGKDLIDKLLMPWRLLVAIIQALHIIHQFKPDVVLGMGGFVSGPGGVASWLLRYPLVVHEQNAKVGLTNQWLARIATKVLEGFPNTFSRRKNVVTVGNPLRKEIAELPGPVARFDESMTSDSQMRLLVLGGSLGAKVINEMVPRVLAKIPSLQRPQVYHQTGERHFEETRQAYQAAGVKAEIKAFISDMDKAYAWADVVLCRAGALTISELCAAGLGAILIPYPHSVDDHQTANANYMVKHQAALLIQQASLTDEVLIETLKEFDAMPKRRLDMAQAAYALRQTDATHHVWRICKEICA